MRWTHPVERGERLVLECLILRHGFDDQVAGLQGLHPHAAGDASEYRVARLRVQLGLLDEAVERLPETAEPALQQRIVGFDDDGVETRLRRHLHDARAHEPTPDDADPFDVHSDLPAMRGADELPTWRPGGQRPRRPGSIGTSKCSAGGQGFLTVMMVRP